MASSREFQPYVETVEDFLRPLLEATEDTARAEGLLRELGYAPPGEVLAFRDLGILATTLLDLIDRIRQAIDEDSEVELLERFVELIPELGRTAQTINDFQKRIQENFAGSPFLDQTDIVAAIARKLTDYLVIRYLENYHPAIFGALLLGGVIEEEDVEQAPSAFQVPYRKRSLNWGTLGALLTDPLESLKANLEGGDQILYDRLLYLLYELGLSLGLLPIFGSPKPKTLTTLNKGVDLTPLGESEQLTTLYFPVVSDPTLGIGFDVYPLADPTSGKYTGLALGIRGGAQAKFDITKNYCLQVKADAAARDGLGVRIGRNGDISFVSSLFNSPAELASTMSFGISFEIAPTEIGLTRKLLAIGAPAGTRFEIGSGSVKFGIEKLEAFDAFIEAELHNGLLSIKAAGADSFISTLLPPDGITAKFDLGAGISNRAGFYFKGSSSLSIRLPLHISLGPINVENLDIGFGVVEDEFTLTLGSGFSATFGPLAAVVENIGVRGIFKAKDDRSGNLGPIDLSFGFKPPNGVGLSIDAGVIKGGGYLYFDYDKEEYAGALELAFAEFLTLKAIGLITTRMPDGSKGFSLLIIITAEFGSPIQLSFGFTLSGVGGLLGLHRTMMLQPLAEGVRTGAVNSVMFPTNVVANAPRIISDLRSFFPPYEGIFLIGPMAKIGWGTPNLVTLSLGIIIEIPGNIAILGVLKVVLPDEQADLLRLQVNFIGAIEFDKKRIWFYASMFDSRVLWMTLEGQMGVFLAWGDDPNFVISVGGFHPAFNPPPLPFPEPNRICISILNESWARVRVEGYFAVTSNTVQFGARAELYFGVSAFNIDGQLVFDALFRFSPFYMIIQISASLSVKVFGVGLFSVRMRGSLEGPTPWHIEGTGSISLLFFDIDVDFSHTWGQEADTTLPPIEVVPLLKAEFEKAENWKAEVPAANTLSVSLRTIDSTEGLILHPVGTLRVSQRAVPLELTIDKVGAQKPSDANHFTLSIGTDAANPAGTETAETNPADETSAMSEIGPAYEMFAMAQFKDMSDSGKLNAPSFERWKGGVRLSVKGEQFASTCAVKRVVRYEQVIIDSNFKRFVKHFTTFPHSLFKLFLKGNAVTKSVLSNAQKKQRMPFEDKISITPNLFVVASNTDNSPLDQNAAGFTSYAEAEQFMNQKVGENPNLKDSLHVIPQSETRMAA